MTREERLSALWDFYKNNAFLKNYSLERYTCDPFAPVIRLEEGVFALPHLSPDRIAPANVFLVCGKERALLIDTAYGIGDLRALCGELTDLPLILANTHFHPDHTGGNTRFGSCFMHENDASKPDLLRKPQQITVAEKDPLAFYTLDDVALPGRGSVTPIKDGHIFDLGGGFEVEAIYLGGHTAGSIALLDRKRGILFTGDAVMTQPCSTMIVNFAGTSGDRDATVEAFTESLERLIPRMDEINYICPSHCAPRADKTLITDAYECCRDIMKDPDIGGEARFFPGARLHIRGNFSLTYSPGRVYR